MLSKSINRRYFSSAANAKRVCMLAHSKQADLQGAKIMQALKTVNDGKYDLHFFGYGGKYMQAEGFEQTFDFNIDNLLDKTFHTYRKSKTSSTYMHWKWNPFNLINKHYMRNADQAMDLFTEYDLPKRIFKSKPSLVLNIGNEYLTMQLMEELKPFYDKSRTEMPSRQIFTRFVRDFKEFTLPMIDYCHYTVPLQTANNNGFVFPGEYVGQYGTYEAIKHVYEQNPSMSELVHDDYLLVNKRYFAVDVEKGVEKIRGDFRTKHHIKPEAYAIFIAPGNEASEAKFCMENLRKGVKEFLLKYSAPTSMSPKALPLEDNFVTIISTHKGSDGEKYVEDYLCDHGWHGKLIQVTNEGNAHYEAMAASDFGFVYDGQMVSAANALHLPVNCLMDMRMQDQFWQNFYNRWWNDMNIIADNSLNPELVGGQAWYGKFSEQLAESYVNPDGRYDTITKCDGFVQDALSFKPLDRVEVRTRDLMLDDGQSYDQYYDPFLLTANNMMKSIESFKSEEQGANVSGLKVQIPNL